MTSINSFESSSNQNKSKTQKEPIKVRQTQEQEILDKWLVLQKTIKEEISLEETISQQLEVNHKKLIDNYYTYYKEKIKLREISDKIFSIDKGETKHTIYEIKNKTETEEILSDIYNPVQNLLFQLRNTFCYIETIADIIDEETEVPISNKHIDSLVELFCHQSFENILIPNPEQEELLLLVYLLLKREIEQMNYASPYGFLDQTSFVGKFLESFTKKQELKSYLSAILGKLILDIDNMDKKNVFLNPSTTRLAKSKNVKKKKESKKNLNNETNNNNNDTYNEYEVTPEEVDDLLNEDILSYKIPKSSIHFNKKIEFVEEDSFPVKGIAKRFEQATPKPIKDVQQNNTPLQENENKKQIKEYNEMYKQKIDQDLLIELINKETDINLLSFYNDQLEHVSKNPDIFTNKKLLESIKENENQKQTLLKYRNSFLYIRDIIEQIIQVLIDKITNFPYTFRCICKIIHLLISKKFPKINTFAKNALVGEFLLGKCILPILINSDINAIVTSTILNDNTRHCLKIVAKVLTQINRGSFFDMNVDPDFTIFNHYIMEVLPKLNEFYGKLINVPMPHYLNEVIDKYLNEPLISTYEMSKIKYQLLLSEEKEDILQKTSTSIEYDYFKYNPEESINIQCICFSISDILFLTKLLKKNIDRFKGFPKFNFFQKTVSKLENSEYKIAEINEPSDTGKEQNKEISKKTQKIFLVYREFQNPQYTLKKEANSLLLDKKQMNSSDDSLQVNDDSLKKANTLRQIKFCIKTVLKGLNTLNPKDFPYLSLADSNYRFLLALKYTLNDLDDFSELEPNSIPLKWYGQFIINNRNNLHNDFTIDDYKKLFNSVLEEEKQLLEILKEQSTSIFTKNGMNIRCAEKLIEKEQTNVFRINKVKRCMKIQKFIFSNKGPNVCITFDNEEKALINDNKSKIGSIIMNLTKGGNEKESQSGFIRIDPIEKCIHTKLFRIQGINIDKDFFNTKAKNKNMRHAFNVDKFIYYLNKYFKKYKDNNEGKSFDEGFYKQLSKMFNIYMKHVKHYIEKDLLFQGDDEEEKVEVLERIEDYIQKRLNKAIFPEHIKENEDIEFYKMTSLMSTKIKPEDLGLNELLVHELGLAISAIQNIDKGKSVFEKLDYVSSAYGTMNNTFKFSLGQDKEGGAEDMSPIFHYIVIKATPKHYFTNIFYIKSLLPEMNTKGHYGYLLSQLEFAGDFVKDYYMQNYCNAS